MKKIHITTLGCSKNTVDSEVMIGRLKSDGHKFTEYPEDAEVIILNTCGFIEDAKKESVQAILEAVELKKTDPAKKVIIAGCLSQRYPAQIHDEIPEVDAVFGTEAYDDIAKKIGRTNSAAQNEHYFRNLTTPEHFAYLKIAEGCDHTCSFCAIPSIRGTYRSRPISTIVDEAKRLVELGVKEIILISQDSSYYGIDLYKKQKIVQLIEKLLLIDELKWLRVLYWYPSNFPMEILPLMKSSEKLVSYIDLPMQHISSNILKRMRRAGTRRRLEHIFRTAREDNPEIALRTTMILGYPGESDGDFNQLYRFVEEIRFDRLGTFVYSDEDQTLAFNQNDKVPVNLAKKRQHQIMELQKAISLEKNRELIGKDVDVLIDDIDHNSAICIGRTYKDAPEIDNEVILKKRPGMQYNKGDFRRIRIEDATEYELYG